MARIKQTRRRNPSPKGPVLLRCSVDRNTRAAPVAGSRTPMIQVDDHEGCLLEESSIVGQPDPRTFVHDSQNLMEQINTTIAEHATSGTLMDFKMSVKLIHILFEAAAAVATVAQMDDPVEQTEDLDALYDHALAGMGLIDSKQQADP